MREEWVKRCSFPEISEINYAENALNEGTANNQSPSNAIETPQQLGERLPASTRPNEVSHRRHGKCKGAFEAMSHQGNQMKKS